MQLTIMAKNNAIQNSWSLVAFAKAFNSVKEGECKNANGEKFPILAFTDANKETTLVGFSQKYQGERNFAGVVAQKNNLQVVEYEGLKGDQRFAICPKGENTWKECDLSSLL